MRTTIERFTALDAGAMLARMLVARGGVQDLDLGISDDAVTLVLHATRSRRVVSKGIESARERIRFRRLWIDHVSSELRSARRQTAATRRKVTETRAYLRALRDRTPSVAH